MTVTICSGGRYKKNDSNKSCRDHERLSFGDLDFELNLEVDLVQIQPTKTRSAANPAS